MDNKICQIHNEPVIFQEEDAQNKLLQMCRYCMQQKSNAQKIDIDNATMYDKKFNYQLMQQSSYKQIKLCYSIAFNKDSSIMIASCDKLIRVFEFKDDKLREVQQLKDDSNDVAVLHFMKKSNQFISASLDLIMWEQNQDNQWQKNQVLKAHSDYIRNITTNQNENMLISGSADFKIKFWNKQNNIWSSNQSINCDGDIFSISLNDQEDQIIANTDEKQILIIELQGKKWIIKQLIKVEQYGYRLCFINQDQFVFQPQNSQHLLIFDYDLKDQTFKKGQELQYSNKASDDYCIFPIRYIFQIGLIMVKNDHHVHLIKKSLNGQFTVEQSINFNTNCLFGSINDDGRYIATWDNKSKQIQIRKFQY